MMGNNQGDEKKTREGTELSKFEVALLSRQW